MAQIAEIEEQMAQTVQGQSIVEGELIPIMYGETPEQAQQDQEIMKTTADHWYSEFSEFLGNDIFPPRASHLQREAFVEDLKNFAWEDPFLYHRCPNGMFRGALWSSSFREFWNTAIYYKLTDSMEPSGQPQECCSQGTTGRLCKKMLTTL